MCGRMTLREEPAVVGGLLEAQVDVELTAAWRPRFNVSPTQRHPILRIEDGVRWLRAGRWGLRKDDSDKRMHINARGETAKHLPAFRDAFRARRCVVPVDGFYEWLLVDGAKQPVWFHAADGGLLLFAGLWEPSPTVGATFTVLTTTPNDVVSPVHDRMPVILQAADVESWLRGTEQRRLLVPAPNERLASRWANPRVNSPRYDDPACLEVPGTVEESRA